MPLQTDGVILDVVAADPGSPVEGQLWYNSTDGMLKISTLSGTVLTGMRTFQVAASGDTTTSSSSDVAVPSMTLTPGAGTYFVFFTSDWSNSGNNASQFASCYANGVKVGNSERQYARSTTSKRDGLAINCFATVDDAQAIEVRWRVSNGTGTIGNRTLTLLRVT